MPIMVLPLLSTIIAGLLMMTLIGKPIVWLQKTLIHLLESMQGGSHFVMGAILGAMATFDFGGPINKTMSLFADGLLVEWHLRAGSGEVCRLHHSAVRHHPLVSADAPQIHQR